MKEVIKIIEEKISFKELKAFLNKPFVDLIKFVIDLDHGIIALGGELHADAEALLLDQGSSQQALWGGNIYPDKARDKKIEYESLINIRPSQGNNSLEIQDNELKLKIDELVNKLIELE